MGVPLWGTVSQLVRLVWISVKESRIQRQTQGQPLSPSPAQRSVLGCAGPGQSMHIYRTWDVPGERHQGHRGEQNDPHECPVQSM
jgi:hypothetical protein